MKIVQFKNGKYGIRKWFFGWKFADLKLKGRYWWPVWSDYYSDCQGTKENVIEIYGQLPYKDFGKVVNIIPEHAEEYICLSCKKVFWGPPKCCGDVELFIPEKHGELLVANSNSWIDISKKWNGNLSLEKVSERLSKDGCYGASTHMNVWIEELLEKEENKC